MNCLNDNSFVNLFNHIYQNHEPFYRNMKLCLIKQFIMLFGIKKLQLKDDDIC